MFVVIALHGLDAEWWGHGPISFRWAFYCLDLLEQVVTYPFPWNWLCSMIAVLEMTGLLEEVVTSEVIVGPLSFPQVQAREGVIDHVEEYQTV